MPSGGRYRHTRRRAPPTVSRICRVAGAVTWSGDDIEEIPKFLDVTTPPWESWVSDPPTSKLPYQPWALAERTAHRDGLGREVWSKDPSKRLYYDPQAFCMKSVPRYSQRGYELVQTKDTVVMMLNWGHIYRMIPLDNGRSGKCGADVDGQRARALRGRHARH